jgi:hypothetical protein
METIELKLDEQTLRRARRLAASRGVSLEDLVGELLSHAATASPNDGSAEVEDPLWGMFRADADLLDRIVEDAMQARELDPLRLEHG